MTTGQISPTEYQQQPKTPPSPTEPSPHPKNKLLLPLILTLFLLLITLIVGGVFALKYYTTPQTTTLSIENQPIPPTSPFNTQSTPSTKNQPNSTITPLKESPSPTPDPTANWRTYTNTTLSYSFKYPENFKLSEESSDKVRISNNLPPDPNCKGGVCNLEIPRLTIYFEHLDNPSEDLLDLDEFAQQRRKSALLLFNEQSSLQTTQKYGYEMKYFEGITEGFHRTYLLKLSSNINFTITVLFPSKEEVSKYSQLENQILSTFKFLDTNSVILDSSTDISSISSPLTIKGKAKSNWFSEGVFPIKLLDENRQLISSTNARELIPGSWVTQEWVAFTASINFNSQSPTGILVFEKSNPSGLSKNDNAVEYQVTFKLPNN